MLLCIQTGKTLADADRFRFDGTGYFIKPAADMFRLDSSDLWQEGCRNSQLLIADRVDTTGMFEFRNLMPRFPIPDGFESEEELFRAEVWKGMDRRYPDGYDEERRKQAEYEIQIICQMGFPAYFLVVADFIMWAKNNGIAVGPGRGSAAGSIVAYAMGVHHRPRPAGARPDLRALPQPRTHLHARHRHRLRRARAGQRDQVRDPEMGLGPGRADHHLRHDQGQGRDQGFLPGCSATRMRWGTGSPRRSRLP